MTFFDSNVSRFLIDDTRPVGLPYGRPRPAGPPQPQRGHRSGRRWSQVHPRAGGRHDRPRRDLRQHGDLRSRRGPGSPADPRVCRRFRVRPGGLRVRRGQVFGDLPDSPPDMVGSCLVCFQGVSGCRPGVMHDMIGHRTGSRVPSLRVSAAVRCQLWLFSGQRRHGRAWQLGRVAYKPMLQAGSPMLDAARQPAPISSAAP